MPPYIFHTRVSYADIDQSRNLSLIGAMRMMQEAAIIHSDLSGYSVMDVERTGVVWMLIQWRVKLQSKVRWNEPVDVETWPQTMEKLTSNRCFRIKNTSGELVAAAESSWVLVNAETGKMMRISPDVADAYTLIPDGVFEDVCEKLPQKTGEEVYSFCVPRRDLDTNHHVNNLVYLDYALGALPDHLEIQDFSEVIVRYHQQLLLGDEVHCYLERLDNGFIVQICGADPRHVHCSVRFVR